MSPVGWRLFHGLFALALVVPHGAFGSPDSLSELGTLIPVNPSRSTSGKDSCLVLALGVDITYIFSQILTFRGISTVILSYNGWMSLL